ncbi:MAG: universal stress protein [Actinomycetia bacterium]|nr:universal stress protein [Actinomycetes bacterium]
MHVMIATDGTLDPKRVAAVASRLAADGGRVSVFTVVEVPRRLLADMRAAASEPDERLQEVTTEYRTTQAEDQPPIRWIGDDNVVARYVRSKVADAVGPLGAALTEAGVEHEIIGEEGEDATGAILAAIGEHDVDILCIGPCGLGRFEGLLGSTSTKLARRAPCSVVLVR